MKKRLASLLLVLAMLPAFFVFAAPARAASSEKADRLCQKIIDNYKAARRICYVSSFRGLCGACVSAQTYALGIDTVRNGCDGKDQFDLYAGMDMTTGGYRVRSYPAPRYTLRSALDAITGGGKWDVYNLVVGFQSSNTPLGSRYGHSLFVYGILDGMVYFAESFATSFTGKYVPEGKPIVCSIADFCKYYGEWTVFDGVILFGEKTYAAQCQEYPASMYCLVTRDTPTYTAPGDEGVCLPEPSGNALVMGEKIRVESLLKTPGGDWWLLLDTREYIPADAAAFQEHIWEDVVVSGLKVPGVLRRGSSFFLGGVVSSEGNQLTEVTVSVYAGGELTFSGTLSGSGNALSLNDKGLDRHLTFRSLPVGTYRIVITAAARHYALVGAERVVCSREIAMYDGQFRVVSDWKSYPVVSFDGNGGTPEYNQSVIAPGQTVGKLPDAFMDGGNLLGWALDEDGKEMVTEDFAPETDVRLYAVWTPEDPASPKEGWITRNGMDFYLDGNGEYLTGWQQIGDKTYCFNSMGVRLEGWQEIQGNRYYLYKDGGYAVGWERIDGADYFFEKDGIMQTGWVSRWGAARYLQNDGKLLGMGRSLGCSRDPSPESVRAEFSYRLRLPR